MTMKLRILGEEGPYPGPGGATTGSVAVHR